MWICQVWHEDMIWISKNSSHYVLRIFTIYMYMFSLKTCFSSTLTFTDRQFMCPLSHTHAYTHSTHKIQMSPHSILCETLLSWLLPWVLLQRIGMLIKACSLKLIRHWPGSFIKIDILLHTLRWADLGHGREQPSRVRERELEKDRKNEGVGKRKRLQVHLPSSSIAIYWATWAQERGQACIPLF